MSDPRAEYLAKIGSAVAAWLQGGWELDEVQSTSFRLKGPEGRGIIFWAGTVNLENPAATCVEVSGIYNLNAYISDADKAKARISMSVKKGARAMARDVQRRFLPKYEAIYAEALETHKRLTSEEEARERLLADLREALDGFEECRDCDNHLRYLERKVSWHEDSYDGKLNANLTSKLREEKAGHPRRWSVDLELKSLTVDQALRIAEVLKEPAFPSEQLSLL